MPSICRVRLSHREPPDFQKGAANRQKDPLRKFLLFFLLFLGLVAPAQAAVTLTFYSRDMHVGLFNIQFPHGFIVLSGMTDAGVPVDANYGFTATEVTPAIVFGPVDGEIISAKPDYIADARSHFSLKISDDHYQAVMALIAAWRGAPQPSYDLNSHNCMTFIKATAVAAGLDVSDAPRFMGEPSDFLDDVATRNPGTYNGAMAESSRLGQAFALDTTIPAKTAITNDEMKVAVKEHILASGEVGGTGSVDPPETTPLRNGL